MMPLFPSDYLKVMAWVGAVSCRVGIFTLLLLPLTLVFRNKLKARLHYLLWCLVFAGLLLPWAPPSPVSIYNLASVFPTAVASDQQASGPNQGTGVAVFPDPGGKSGDNLKQSAGEQTGLAAGAAGPSGTLTEGSATPVVPAVPVSPAAAGGSAFYGLPSFGLQLLCLLWFAGILVLTLSTLVANRRFARTIKGRPVAEPQIIAVLEEARLTLGCRKTIPLLLTEGVKTPSLFGLFRPRLLLPAGALGQLNAEQLGHVFSHELAHWQRKDIFVLWLARCLLIVHWFNPLLWYAFRRLRESQELACDETVLSRLGAHHAAAYGLTLLTLLENCACGPRLLNATPLSGPPLKKRIALIRNFGKTSWKWTLPVLLLVASLALVTFSSAMAEPVTPLSDDASKAPLTNPLLEVNSLAPIALNPELVEKAKNWQGTPEFAVTGDSDVASVAYGWMLRSQLNNPGYQTAYPEIDWEKMRPAQPLLVKSYEWGYPDYYLVPFVQDGRFAARATVSVSNQEKTTVRFTDGGILDPAVARFLSVDAAGAMQRLREEKGLSEVPVPRLVFHRDLTGLTEPNNKIERASLEPAWEFVLADNSRLYVNQAGQVLAKDVIPWYEKLATSPYHPENTTIEANTLRRDDGWSLNIEKIVLSGPYAFDPVLQSVEVYCRAANNAGPDQLFMPRGTLVSITAAGGKTYPIRLVPLDQTYIDMQQMRLRQNETAITAGQLKMGVLAEADATDTQFSSLTYRDEDGREFQIPLTLAPVFNGSQTPANTLNAKPFPVPGKDWGIALTRLEFRLGDWTDKKVAFLELTVLNNQGPDQAFAPTGKIVGIMGGSGKLYPDYSDSSFAEMYQGRENYFAAKGRPMYQPGILTVAPEILVDGGEKTITKVIYQDENGKKYEIPLQEISPVIKAGSSNAQ
jgi:beta-lactamase regulating signal transducer with metallopeptidase domain